MPTHPESHPWHSDGKLWGKLKSLARQKRHAPTPAEERLWGELRNRQVAGVRFRRQHTLERFIMDFYAASARLIIEVDGPIHDYTAEEDAIRQEFLEAGGFTVMRFTNDEVMNNLARVVDQIEGFLTSPPQI